MTTISSTPTNAVGIRFQKLGKTYHFKVNNYLRDNIVPGDQVVVETQRGRQMGQVIAFIPDDQINRRRKLRPVEDKATPRDLVMKQVWESKDLDALITCRELAHKLGVPDTTFVRASYNFEGSWITIYYSNESNNKVDYNPLCSQLGRILQTRIEMQIIGPRDVAKLMGGQGACGIPRCCSTFLTEFSPVSIKMAKEQGVSLSPQEITGMCGRLRCCLIFEYEQYIEARKKLPRQGKRVGTSHGVGIVIDQLPIQDAVRVKVGDKWHVVPRRELEPLAELEALKKKAEAGCSKHQEGGCDCGAKK